MNRRLSTLLAGLTFAALTLSACGSDTLEPAGSAAPTPTGGASSSIEVAVDEALAAKLPEKVKASKKIIVGTDASYAPNEFTDTDGKTIVGMDVDLFRAVAQQFGVEVEFQPSNFDSIITGVNGGKYTMGISSFTINPDRLKVVNMVSYFKAGTQWATPAGNPKGVDPANPCGKTIAVQQGTVQQEVDLPARQAKCGADKINVLPFEGQDQATAAVATGRADAMLADSPVTVYAVQQSGGKVESLGPVYDAAPYGWIVPKDETEFADALAEALKKAKENGTYDRALSTWGLQEGAIDDFAVNPGE